MTAPRSPLLIAAAVVLPLFIAGCGCGNDADHNTDASSGQGTNGTLNDASATGSAGAQGAMDANGSATSASGDMASPGMERMRATTDLGGLRARLMAELDLVRTRLNDGTRPKDATEADQQRAAELAQGLERLDRALAAINASNDTSWAAIRSSSMQEVEDIKAWMERNGMRTAS